MVYTSGMRIFCPFIVIITILISGCATVSVGERNVFPFRAGFVAKGIFNGTETELNGAMLITSPDKGVFQVYGPGGIAVYVLKIDGGTAILTDTWGRKTGDYNIHVKNMAGLLAGVPPSGLRCSTKAEGDGTVLKYLWGDVTLDRNGLPELMSLKGEQNVKAVFSKRSGGIDLMIGWGSDNFTANITVIEGGRWKDAEGEMQDMR